MKKLSASRVHLPRRLFAPSRPLDAVSRHELQAIVDRRSGTAMAVRPRHAGAAKPTR